MAGTKKETRGRPKLPKGDAKSKNLIVRLTGDDLNSLAAMANKEKLSVSDWVRSKLSAMAVGEQVEVKPVGETVWIWRNGTVVIRVPNDLTKEEHAVVARYATEVLGAGIGGK